MKLIVMISALMFSSLAHSALTKPKDDPACANIAAQCEAAGFTPGAHKTTGKGLWADCVRQVAKGGAVAGVTATADEAKTCQGNAKETRASNKATRAARKAAKGTSTVAPPETAPVSTSPAAQ